MINTNVENELSNGRSGDCDWRINLAHFFVKKKTKREK